MSNQDFPCPVRTGYGYFGTCLDRSSQVEKVKLEILFSHEIFGHEISSCDKQLKYCFCVRLCAVIFFSLEHLKQDVLRELQGCLRGVCLKF